MTIEAHFRENAMNLHIQYRMNVGSARQVQHTVDVALLFERRNDAVILRSRLGRAFVFERELKFPTTQRKRNDRVVVLYVFGIAQFVPPSDLDLVLPRNPCVAMLPPAPPVA